MTVYALVELKIYSRDKCWSQNAKMCVECPTMINNTKKYGPACGWQQEWTQSKKASLGTYRSQLSSFILLDCHLLRKLVLDPKSSPPSTHLFLLPAPYSASVSSPQFPYHHLELHEVLIFLPLLRKHKLHEGRDFVFFLSYYQHLEQRPACSWYSVDICWMNGPTGLIS